MQNKFYIPLIIGLILFAFIAMRAYQTKTARNAQNPNSAVIEKDAGVKNVANVENVANGSIVLPESITQFAANGPDGLVSVDLNEGIGQLPVGTYSIGLWQAERKDNQGNTWTLIGRCYDTEGSFEVTDSSRTNVDVGEPFIAVVNGSRIGPKYYTFSQSIQGRLDEQISLTRNGSRPGAPKLRIRNNDGSYDRTFAFQYG